MSGVFWVEMDDGQTVEIPVPEAVLNVVSDELKDIANSIIEQENFEREEKQKKANEVFK